MNLKMFRKFLLEDDDDYNDWYEPTITSLNYFMKDIKKNGKEKLNN